MIVFELSMPNRASWNGKWSGQDSIHVIIKKEINVPKDVIGKSFYYQWDDGWGAEIKVYKINSNSKEYRKLKKLNKGFCGYNWMVDSIIKFKEIRYIK